MKIGDLPKAAKILADIKKVDDAIKGVALTDKIMMIRISAPTFEVAVLPIIHANLIVCLELQKGCLLNKLAELDIDVT